MTTFWSLYITALTVGTLIALLWLVFATRKGEAKGTTEKTMGHSYDGIEEYDNPLPKWWFMLYIGTIVHPRHRRITPMALFALHTPKKPDCAPAP